MDFVTIFIPTYNRIDELLITLPQVVSVMDEKSEIIVFDQSDTYDPNDYTEALSKILENVNAKYYHCDIPSVPLAWNSCRSLARGDIILFLDDDIDIESNIINSHRSYYEDSPDIVGVAGGYYAGNWESVWIPSSKNGAARTFAGVNVSFRSKIFSESGSASSFIKPFAGIDWELAEHVTENFGKLAIGEDALVFHRAPAKGGCENQSERGIDWYYGCYYNHALWMFYRDFPKNVTMLPRHFYWLLKYCLPRKDLLLNRKFWMQSVLGAIKNSYKQYRADGNTRRTQMATELSLANCILDLPS